MKTRIWLWFGIILTAALAAGMISCGGGGGGGNGGLTFAEPAYFVSVDDLAASDANPGSMDLPFATIQAAVDAAAVAHTLARVYVAEGTYLVSYQAGTHVVLPDGIEIFGGYSADWSERDPSVFTSTITDTSTTGGSDPNNSNRAVDCSVALSAPTIDGFTINGGAGTASTGVYIYNAGPTLSRNTISGGSGTTYATGVYVGDSVPIINLNIISGGTGPLTTTGIYVELNSAPLITLNIIDGGSGDYARGIYQSSSWSVTPIEMNTITGGTGNAQLSIAINNATNSTSYIASNTIHGGSGQNTQGIQNFRTGMVSIFDNFISGGVAVNTARGINNDSSGAPATIANNVVYAGSSFNTFGISSIATSLLTIERNVIHGGRSTAGSYALDESGTSNDVRNNLIHGGEGGTVRALRFYNSGTLIRNNTVSAGDGTLVYGLQVAAEAGSPTPVVENNLFMNPASSSGYGIFESTADGDPISVRNNNFDGFGLETYYDHDGGCGMAGDADPDTCTADEVNSLGDMTVSSNTAAVPLLEDVDGPDDDLSTMEDNLWSPSASSPGALTSGGLDLSSDFTDDYTGTTRTAPWSIGAYEYD